MMFDERIPTLGAIADGAPVEWMQVPLSAVVGHMKCPECETALVVNDSALATLTTIKVKGSARPGDRIRAIDTLGKYGLGDTTVEVASEVVQECVRKWQELVESRDVWPAAELQRELARIWITETNKVTGPVVA